MLSMQHTPATRGFNTLVSAKQTHPCNHVQRVPRWTHTIQSNAECALPPRDGASEQILSMAVLTDILVICFAKHHSY